MGRPLTKSAKTPRRLWWITAGKQEAVQKRPDAPSQSLFPPMPESPSLQNPCRLMINKVKVPTPIS